MKSKQNGLIQGSKSESSAKLGQEPDLWFPNHSAKGEATYEPAEFKVREWQVKLMGLIAFTPDAQTKDMNEEQGTY